MDIDGGNHSDISSDDQMVQDDGVQSLSTMYFEEDKKGGRPQSEIRTLFFYAVYHVVNGGTCLNNVKHYSCKGCMSKVGKKLEYLRSHAKGCGAYDAKQTSIYFDVHLIWVFLYSTLFVFVSLAYSFIKETIRKWKIGKRDERNRETLLGAS